MSTNGLARRLANLQPPYKPGENHHTRKAAERAQLESEIAAELGVALTASERLELRHAIDLLTRRPRDDVDAVRCSNAGSRIIAKVRTRIKQRENNRPAPCPPAADQAALALALLLNKSPPDGV